MDLVARVKAIALKPKEEWVKIKAETTSVSELFTSYAMILAAIPAVAQFIGFALIGRRYANLRNILCHAVHRSPIHSGPSFVESPSPDSPLVNQSSW